MDNTNEKRPVSPVNGQPLPQGRPPFKPGEEAREIGKRGGKRSVEVRRARKTLREELLELLTVEISDSKGNKNSTQAALSNAIIKQALSGNTKAFEIIRDTIGEKPVERLLVSDVDPSVVDEVERMING